MFNALDRDCEWNIGKEDTIRKVIKRLQSASLPQPSSGQWIKVQESLPEPMQEVDIVVVRTSDGQFVDQWSQIAWRRPVGLWIDDEDIVERKTRHDKMDRRVITHWAKRQELPVAPSAGHTEGK